MDSFNWKSKNSYTDFGIIIVQKPPIPKPERNVEEIEIPGRDGDITVDYATYKSVTFALACNLRFSIKSIDEIKVWLNGFDHLSFSWQNDRYYDAKLINRIDIAQSLKLYGEFPLIFKAQPHARALTNAMITLTTSPSTIVNNGTANSKPVIKVYGTGMITLIIGSYTIVLANVVGYETIDSDLVDCYKDTTLKNSDMTGSFPDLVPGNNIISWTGAVTKIEITPNWRFL